MRQSPLSYHSNVVVLKTNLYIFLSIIPGHGVLGRQNALDGGNCETDVKILDSQRAVKAGRERCPTGSNSKSDL